MIWSDLIDEAEEEGATTATAAVKSVELLPRNAPASYNPLRKSTGELALTAISITKPFHACANVKET